MAVALAMATATAMSTSSCASDSSLSRVKNCVCVCPSVEVVVVGSGREVTASDSTPATLSVAPVAGDGGVRVCGGAAVELAVVVVVVSLAVVVSERWSLSARRRAVLPLPLWEEEPPCAEVVSDALCALSWSQDSGLCDHERASGVDQLALVSAAAAVECPELAVGSKGSLETAAVVVPLVSAAAAAAATGGGWQVSAAAAACPELHGGSKGSLWSAAAAFVAVAAAVAWVAEAGTEANLELAAMAV